MTGPARHSVAEGVVRTALWVVPVSDLGGVARHVLDVAQAGIPGWRVVYLLPPGPLAERLRAAGAAVLTGPVGPDDGVAAGLRTVRHTVTRLRPAVVHSHLSYADVLAAAVAVGLPCRLVTTEHGLADDDLVYHGTAWRSRLKAAMHTARLRRVDAAIAVSTATAEVMRRKWHPRHRLPITVLHNGVDCVQHVPREPGLHILSLARLAPEKGLPLLLGAFAEVHRVDPTARLTLAGAGPLERELRELVQRLDLVDAVDLPGHVEPGPALRTHDVLAQLSVWENCSYSILDAVTHGLGVVAARVGGNPEILPQQCLVARDGSDAVAKALTLQGASLASRPQLPPGWPSVAEMCTGIAQAYAEVTQ